jgi:hypothetical protein
MRTFKAPTEKRRLQIVAKMKAWFSIKQGWEGPEATARAALLKEDEAAMLSLMRLVASRPNEVGILVKYVNTHRQAVMEMTEEDLKEVQDHFRIAAVHSS